MREGDWADKELHKSSERQSDHKRFLSSMTI